MIVWDEILTESQWLADQFRQRELDLSETEKAGDYYIHKDFSEEKMLEYLAMMARNPPPRSRRSQRYYIGLFDIWRQWASRNKKLTSVDKARAWGWAVRMAKSQR